MVSNNRATTSAVRGLSWAATLLIVVLGPAMRAQTPLPAGLHLQPVCSAPPSPGNDTWPVANPDSIGTTPGAPVIFTSAVLLANDVGGSLLTVTAPIVSKPYAGGTVTGIDPFTYTPPPLFAGTDVFTYEISDLSGRRTTGIARVTVTADQAPPQVAITAPAAGQVSGSVTVTATAFDNVGVAGVRLFVDGVQLGAEVTALPFRALWDTTLAAGGPHTLTASARDAAGNVGTSAAVAVNVFNPGDVTPPQVAITAPAAGQVSGSVTVTATAVDTVGVAGVRLFVDGVQLGAEITALPFQASWDTTLAADGPHTLTASARDAAGNVGASAAVAVTVSNPVAATPPSVDTMVFADGLNRRTTPLFSTTQAGDVLVAFAASDGPAAVNSQTLTISGAGLVWSRVKRAAARYGVSEIWTATATGLLSNVTVSSTQAVTGYRQSLTVIAFKGVAGVGASSAAGAASGAPTVGLVTQASGSLVYAVGNDWDRAVARVYPAGQTKVREVINTNVGDTFWVQAVAGTIASAGTPVTVYVTSPVTDQWNLAAVELRASAPGAPPASVTVPNLVGLSDTAARTAITSAELSVGSVSSENSADVPAGQVIRQTPAAGGSAASGSPVGFVLSLGPAATGGGPVVDALVFSDGSGARTTPAFSTTAGAVLVALVGSDGPTAAEGPNNQFLTVSGAGLAWTRVARAAASRGVSEIWTATAPAALTNVTVTSTQSVTVAIGQPVNQSLTVVAFTGASGIGASNIASASSGAPTVSVAAQAAGSLVYAVGNDFDRAVVRSIPAGQTKVHEFLAPSGDTMWAQALVATTSAAGATVTLRATAPTTDQWNFAIVEIKR